MDFLKNFHQQQEIQFYIYSSVSRRIMILMSLMQQDKEYIVQKQRRAARGWLGKGPMVLIYTMQDLQLEPKSKIDWRTLIKSLEEDIWTVTQRLDIQL